MKLTNFLIGIIFVAVLIFPTKINQRTMIKAENHKNAYNEALDNATNDAAKELILVKDNFSLELIADGNKINYKKVNLNLEQSLWRFYNTLFLNLNIEKDFAKQKALLDDIPIMMAIGYDGYYIYSWEEKYINNVLEITNEWSKKKQFFMVDEKYNIKIIFTLDDYVFIENLDTGEIHQGKQESFINKYPNSCFGTKFEQVKYQVVNQMIKKDLEFYTYNNNNIAKKNGWKLKFNIPYWGDRAINEVAFIAFYQGKELVSQKKYNTYGFGTARIVKRDPIYGYEIDGHKLYSKNKIGTNTTNFYNEFEAAQNGYSPDPKYYK